MGRPDRRRRRLAAGVAPLPQPDSAVGRLVSIVDTRDAAAAAALVTAHRDGWSRVVAVLARRFGDLGLAEDCAADAYAVATEQWPAEGVPANPAGWLTLTAHRKAIDRVRRDTRGSELQQEAALLTSHPPDPVGAIDDDRLRLIFTCCHPALAPEARIALTLRLVGGLRVPDIARAFLVPERTMEQRITRAKTKIRAARIPYRVPERDDLPDRVAGVVRVLYLIFNEGYLAGAGEDAVRAELCDEAIRLARLLHALLPEDGEVTGLLALLLLTDARRAARVSADGALVRLDEQDRSRWDAALIAEGHALVRARIASGVPPGPYQLQAAISAVHTYARDARDTDWAQIRTLYDQLARLDPSPIVALNRAVALAEVDGPAAALAEIDRLPLESYHAWHAARADLLRRLGRTADSAAAYTRAIALAGNPAEIAYLTRQRADLQ